MDPIRVLIAEDERLTRDSLARLLDMEDDISVVAQAANGDEAVEMARRHLPEVLLTDINMPGKTGIEVARIVKDEAPATGIVILTIYHDDANVFAAIKAGATGYVLKDSPIDDTIAAIRAIYRGDSLLHPSIAARVLAEFNRVSAQRSADLALFRELTEREVEVLREVMTGKRNREIADSLFISEKTVKNHVSSILFKLQVNDRTEAAMLAARGGLG